MPEYLFVYGSLLSPLGHPAHGILDQQAEFLGSARITGRLYDLGAYPGLVIMPGQGGRVWGEVYRLNQPRAVLPRLDAYEEGSAALRRSGEYRRKRVIARFVRGGGRVRVWVYVYQRPVRGRIRIQGGDYLRYPMRRQGR